MFDNTRTRTFKTITGRNLSVHINGRGNFLNNNFILEKNNEQEDRR